jgi:Flp pilus assembly protein TadD
MFSAAGAVQKSESEIQHEFGVKVARMGSWREAAFRFERAVKADDANARAWNNLGVARESLGDFDAAREAYEKSLALAPDDRRIRQNYERFLNLANARPAAPPEAVRQADQP